MSATVIPLTRRPTRKFSPSSISIYATEQGEGLARVAIDRLHRGRSDVDTELFGLWLRATLNAEGLRLAEEALKDGASWPETKTHVAALVRSFQDNLGSQPEFRAWAAENGADLVDLVLDPGKRGGGE